ncbi:hypothetical protein [Gymnodinialimonas ulvae]|uniref:hypothetical protein n=1 Tax=Gymnodinialimonas ulvae TaxID=3126504 RepID=UPI0030B08F5A
MIGRGALYWSAVWLVCFLGVQLFYWVVFSAVSLGYLLGWTDGGWDAPLPIALSRAMFAVPALVATIVTALHWRDWMARDTP